MSEDTRASIEIYPRPFDLVEFASLVRAASKIKGEVRLEYYVHYDKKTCDLKDLIYLPLTFPNHTYDTNKKINVTLVIDGKGEEQNNLVGIIQKTIHQMHKDDLLRRDMRRQRELEAEERKKPLTYKIAKYFKKMLRRN